MKKQILKGINFLLSAILVMLGFQSCDKDNDDYPVEYGCPHADYTYQGRVTDNSGNALSGKTVIVKPLYKNNQYVIYDHADEEPWRNDTLTTDINGDYFREKSGVMLPHNFRIVVNDPSGTFASDSVEVQDKQIEKGSGWYEGKFEVNADFKLKEK